MMKIYLLLVATLSLVCPRRFCIFQKSIIKVEDKEQSLPYLVKPSQSLNKLKQSELKLMKNEGWFYHYRPHYLHSFSYPQPLTPHLFYGQVNNLGKAIFFVKQNETFKGQNIEEEIFYINGEKEEEKGQNILESGRLSQKKFKFMLILQIQNMFETNIDTRISVYNMGSYFAFISNLQLDYKTFILYFINSDRSIVELSSSLEDIKIYMRNETKYENKESWKNAEHLKWEGRQNVKYDERVKEEMIFQTFVMEIQYNSISAAKRIKLHFRQFPKIQPHQSIQQTLRRISSFDLNSYHYAEKKPSQFTCDSHAEISLFRGLSYEFGTLLLKNGSKTLQNEPKQLLSFSPSRKRFPWGFLWDDGFHCEVAARKNSSLALKVIKSWLNTMTESGWIPREQNRGKEREYLCSCPQFMAKDVRDGNPPTLILSLQYLAKKGILNKENFETEDFNKLKKWYNWFLQTQQTEKNNFIFRWHDSIQGEGSFNSGMDDFPRLKNTSAHIDCQSWMYLFSKAMADISFSLSQNGEQYLKNAEKIKLALIQNFIDPKSNLCHDFSNSSGKNKIFNDNFGYPSILPLAFGILDESSLQFNETLNGIKFLLDTGAGLASISMNNRYYLENKNAYWKGPVWININYLILKGLKQFYPSTEKYYKSLRNDLIKTVCGNWEKTDYFYENYIKGKGSFSYPFTGWTTLISIIINENY